MPDDECPPLAEIQLADLDLDRIPVILAAALAGQPEPLAGMFMRGELENRIAMAPFNTETGMATFTAMGLPVASVHYSMLWRGQPLDLVANPPTTLPAERAVPTEEPGAGTL